MEIKAQRRALKKLAANHWEMMGTASNAMMVAGRGGRERDFIDCYMCYIGHVEAYNRYTARYYALIKSQINK